MKWSLVSYIVYLALLCVAAVYTGVVDLNPVVVGAACGGIAALLSSITTMIAYAFDIDWYFD